MNKPNIQFVENEKVQIRLKVIGVGGCGGNAINTMLEEPELKGVELYAVNTDNQALESIAPGAECVQIGQALTKGEGAGGKHDVGRQAAEQDRERIIEMVDGANMVFITAGMGGGTGTGAAPVIAEICKEKGILTVAVVTHPWSNEGREQKAQEGLRMLGNQTESIIVVPNDRIDEVYPDCTSKEADQAGINVLSNAVSGISEIIYRPGRINVDFSDVRTAMEFRGKAIISSVTESGMDRFMRAANAVTKNPLLDGVDLSTAQALVVNSCFDQSISMRKDHKEAVDIIVRQCPNVGENCFSGVIDDPQMGESVKITIVATGINDGLRHLAGTGAAPETGAVSGDGRYSSPAFKPGPGRTSRRHGNHSQQGSLIDSDNPAVMKKQFN